MSGQWLPARLLGEQAALRGHNTKSKGLITTHSLFHKRYCRTLLIFVLMMCHPDREPVILTRNARLMEVRRDK